MSKQVPGTLLLAVACILAGRLGVADAGPGKKNAEPARLVQVAYPVADLVIPIPDCAKSAEQNKQTQEDQLMKLICATVAPSSWVGTGGQGTIQFFPAGLALEVRQTSEAHAAIAHLLKALRRLQDVEVCVELRLLTTTPEAAAQLYTRAGFEKQAGAAHATALLTEKEIYPWLLVLQGNPATNITLAPKVTMADGQNALIRVGSAESFVTEYKVVATDEQARVEPRAEEVWLGTACKLRPVVTADRRAVRLDLDFRHTTLAETVASTPVVLKVAGADGTERTFRGTIQRPRVNTLAVKQPFVIPAGQTLAIALGAIMLDQRTEMGPPVLSNLPYVNRLFRNVGYSRDPREAFLLVTPRVIVNEEVEEPTR